MAPVINARTLFAAHPEGYPEPGKDIIYDTAETIDPASSSTYWDHVGGEVLDAALEAATTPRAQFIICGMVSGYNNNGLTQVTKLLLMDPKSINMQGINYVVAQLEQKYTGEFMKNISPLVASGKIKYREAVWNGLERVGEALVAVLNGANEGKAVVHVADE